MNNEDMIEWKTRLEAIRNAERSPDPKKPAMARPMTEAEAALLDSLVNGVQHRKKNQNWNHDAPEQLLLAVLEERQTPELFERGVELASALLRAQKAMSDFWVECCEVGIGHRRVGPPGRGSGAENKTVFDIYQDKIVDEAKRRTGIDEP